MRGLLVTVAICALAYSASGQQISDSELAQRTQYGRNAANISWVVEFRREPSEVSTAVALVPGSVCGLNVSDDSTLQLQWRDKAGATFCGAKASGSRYKLGANITVDYGYEPPSTHTAKYELEEGVVIIQIASEPRPALQWTVNGLTIAEGANVGNIKSECAKVLDSERLEATLRIRLTTNEDSVTNIRLTSAHDSKVRFYDVRTALDKSVTGGHFSFHAVKNFPGVLDRITSTVTGNAPEWATAPNRCVA